MVKSVNFASSILAAGIQRQNATVRSQQTPTSNQDDNPYSIPRSGWSLSSAESYQERIIFNINPSSVDFNFQGRRTSEKARYGRIYTQIKANDNMKYMDLDVSFTMQSGNLLNSNGEGIAQGANVLFKILDIANRPLFSNGRLDYHILQLSTPLFGKVVLHGFLDTSAISLSQAAEDPLRMDYPLVFQAFRSNPPLTSYDQLKGAYKG